MNCTEPIGLQHRERKVVSAFPFPFPYFLSHRITVKVMTVTKLYYPSSLQGASLPRAMAFTALERIVSLFRAKLKCRLTWLALKGKAAEANVCRSMSMVFCMTSGKGKLYASNQ